MPLDTPLASALDGYARNDLGGDAAWHEAFFAFLRDPELERRVGQEFFTARYLYKIFEGLRLADQWAIRAQVQLQVQQYASIYEACLHHLLFSELGATEVVRRLLVQPRFLEYPAPQGIRDALAEHGHAQEPPVVAFPASRKIVPQADTRVRFEHKADAAVALGIIEQDLADELKGFYAARNLIHIHAELAKGQSWEWKLEYAGSAYWRLQALKDQVEEWRVRTDSA
ncbi:hypothetical protein AB0L40_16785 [Patulibacter sp. NPDC049589]|uniref:hypothetical protein n=1 Tax=Patulibacter sp. NPDC049589 TaxID=3154731 RepID=UPI00342805BB